MKNIVLVGFMGTGKSAVGRMLARRLKRRFADLDDRISREAGRSIPEIFAAEGEPGFRNREAEAVLWASGLKGAVVSAGGGAILDEANISRLRSSGVLICLRARPEVIARRALNTLPVRPLLAGADPLAAIIELMKAREPHYAKADVSFDTSDHSVSEIAEQIIGWLETQEGGVRGG